MPDFPLNPLVQTSWHPCPREESLVWENAGAPDSGMGTGTYGDPGDSQLKSPDDLRKASDPPDLPRASKPQVFSRPYLTGQKAQKGRRDSISFVGSEPREWQAIRGRGAGRHRSSGRPLTIGLRSYFGCCTLTPMEGKGRAGALPGRADFHRWGGWFCSLGQ